MRNVLKRKKNQLWDSYFFEIWSILALKIGPFSVNFEYKIDHNSKKKIAKIGTLIFHSIQHIAHFHKNPTTFKGKEGGVCISLVWKYSRSGKIFINSRHLHPRIIQYSTHNYSHITIGTCKEDICYNSHHFTANILVSCIT